MLVFVFLQYMIQIWNMYKYFFLTKIFLNLLLFSATMCEINNTYISGYSGDGKIKFTSVSDAKLKCDDGN